MLLLVVPILLSISSSAQQSPSKELKAKHDAEIAGVKFAVPQGFELEQPSNMRVAFMRHAASEIGLFVAVGDHKIDDKYLTDLSNNLASQLLSQKNAFSWKILPDPSSRKVSKYQTGGGTAKGLDMKKYVQADYVILKTQGREVVVGSIATFGNEVDTEYLFNVKGSEYSFLGWEGLFNLTASVTRGRH